MQSEQDRRGRTKDVLNRERKREREKERAQATALGKAAGWKSCLQHRLQQRQVGRAAKSTEWREARLEQTSITQRKQYKALITTASTGSIVSHRQTKQIKCLIIASTAALSLTHAQN